MTPVAELREHRPTRKPAADPLRAPSLEGSEIPPDNSDWLQSLTSPAACASCGRAHECRTTTRPTAMNAVIVPCMQHPLRSHDALGNTERAEANAAIVRIELEPSSSCDVESFQGLQPAHPTLSPRGEGEECRCGGALFVGPIHGVDVGDVQVVLAPICGRRRARRRRPDAVEEQHLLQLISWTSSPAEPAAPRPPKAPLAMHPRRRAGGEREGRIPSDAYRSSNLTLSDCLKSRRHDACSDANSKTVHWIRKTWH